MLNRQDAEDAEKKPTADCADFTDWVLWGRVLWIWIAEKDCRPLLPLWQFTTAEARIRLKKLCPTIEMQ